MKKLFALLALFCFMLPSLAVYAEPRNVFEFCELYALRYARLQQEYDLEQGPSIHYPSSFLGKPMQWGDDLIMNTSGGTVYLSDEYTIIRAEMVLVDSSDDDDDNTYNFISAMMALAALEYSQTEETYMSIMSKINDSYASSAQEQALSIFINDFSPILDDESIWSNLPTTGFPIYEGNYKYSCVYKELNSSDSETHWQLLLVADYVNG